MGTDLSAVHPIVEQSIAGTQARLSVPIFPAPLGAGSHAL